MGCIYICTCGCQYEFVTAILYFLSLGDASALNHWATKDANNQFEFNKKWKRLLSWDDNNQFGPNISLGSETLDGLAKEMKILSALTQSDFQKISTWWKPIWPNNRSLQLRNLDIRWACKRNKNLIWFSKDFNVMKTNFGPITDHRSCGSWTLGGL